MHIITSLLVIHKLRTVKVRYIVVLEAKAVRVLVVLPTKNNYASKNMTFTSRFK